MSKLYKTILVTGSANEETLKTGLVSSEVEKYHIDKLFVTEVTSTPQNDAYIRCYLDRERLVDFPYVHFLQDSQVDVRTEPDVIEIDLDLPVGSEFDIGQLSQANASDMLFTIQYEVVK